MTKQEFILKSIPSMLWDIYTAVTRSEPSDDDPNTHAKVMQEFLEKNKSKPASLETLAMDFLIENVVQGDLAREIAKKEVIDKFVVYLMAQTRDLPKLDDAPKPVSIHYRHKATKLDVEAIQWLPGMAIDGITYDHSSVTGRGRKITLKPGDWVIREPDGVHWYPCKADIFATTYEPILDGRNG